jgi:hypothetical protein
MRACMSLDFIMRLQKHNRLMHWSLICKDGSFGRIRFGIDAQFRWILLCSTHHRVRGMGLTREDLTSEQFTDTQSLIS